MKKNKSARRDFIKLSAMGLGGLAIAPIAGAAQETSKLITAVSPDDKKLHIVCVGAHPGDPEFGCGGTMAKYSDAGHQVTFLYLTRARQVIRINHIPKWLHCVQKKQKLPARC